MGQLVIAVEPLDPATGEVLRGKDATDKSDANHQRYSIRERADGAEIGSETEALEVARLTPDGVVVSDAVALRLVDGSFDPPMACAVAEVLKYAALQYQANRDEAAVAEREAALASAQAKLSQAGLTDVEIAALGLT